MTPMPEHVYIHNIVSTETYITEIGNRLKSREISRSLIIVKYSQFKSVYLSNINKKLYRNINS